jgi:hypothetical protein
MPECNWLARSSFPGTRPRRADHYRAYKQVVGVDPDFINVGGPTDPEFTYTGLPSGKTVNIQITAVNSAGESDPCATGSIVVP